jgi:hypothetical protein
MQLSLTLRLVPIFAIALLFGCDTAPASAPGNGLDTEAAIIRNPVDTRGEEIDTANVALLNFNETEFKFGKVKVGTVINHDFPFTNTGSVPLLITKARSTCGCTVPSYPEAPIAPGESGVISVSFDTKNKNGRQRKPVTIIANTYPATTTIYVDGNVINE